MTGLILIGWVWSIYWGYLIVKKASNDETQVNRFAGQGNPGANVGYGSGMNAGANVGPNKGPYNQFDNDLR